jgi:hypothetical protein
VHAPKNAPVALATSLWSEDTRNAQKLFLFVRALLPAGLPEFYARKAAYHIGLVR